MHSPTSIITGPLLFYLYSFNYALKHNTNLEQSDFTMLIPHNFLPVRNYNIDRGVKRYQWDILSITVLDVLTVCYVG